MMRLLSRHAPVEELAMPFNDNQENARADVPLKAQKLLGEKPRLNYNVEESVIGNGDYAHGLGGASIPPKAQKLLGEQGHVKPNNKSRDIKHRNPESFWSIRDAEHRSRSAFSNPDSETMPGAKPGTALPHMPVSAKSADNLVKSWSSSTEPTGTSSYPGHQPSMESIRRVFYDSSKHPSYVSQQTSESSVRDMRLHRGSPQVSDASSGSPLLPRSTQQSPKYRPQMNDRTASDEPKRNRKVDLSLLLSHPKTSTGIIASGKFARSPSREPYNLNFSPTETVHAQIARHGSKLRLETDRSTKPLPKQPVDDSSSRTKVFEADIFDSRKRNIYRLPKGAKDWFDGIDISSDEEEPEKIEAAPVELPANEVPRVQEALPSVFSPYGTPVRDFVTPYAEDDQPKSEMASTIPRSVGMEGMIQARQDPLRNAAEDVIDGSAGYQRRDNGSRLAVSRLGAQSVLSSASGSRRENIRSPDVAESIKPTSLQEAPSLELHRSLLRNAGGGRNREDAPPNAAVNVGKQSPPAQARLIDILSPPPKLPRAGDVVLTNASPGSHQKPNSSLGLRPATQESYARTGTRSSGEDTASSIPTEGSRLMAVTEEEMMLLERMREKRAAMQKDSFTEGYRVAREEERHNQVRSSDQGSQSAAMYSPARSQTSPRSRDTNRTETLLREDDEMRRRMSAIRKEDVDRAFKMGRFLADETKESTGPTRIEKFLVMATDANGDSGGRPISGTEIETESRYDELDEADDEFASRLDVVEDAADDGASDDEASSIPDEDEDDDAAEGLGLSWNEPTAGTEDIKTPTQEQMPSPLQRLTDQVRDLPKYAARFFDDEVPKQAESLVQSRPAEKVQIPSPHSDDILERLIPRYDNDGQELLSPKVYTPVVRSPRTPQPHSIWTDSQAGPQAAKDDDRVDSPDTPVATTWARHTSLKHPLPQRQAPAMDFVPMESHRFPSAPPSVTTSLPSPLTPTLSSIPHSPAGTVSELAASSNRSPLRISRLASADVPNPLHSHPPESIKEDKPPSTRASPNLTAFKQKQTGRITSMTSITSAGEDVLAAWAELGGGRADALRFKRKKAPTKGAV